MEAVVVVNVSELEHVFSPPAVHFLPLLFFFFFFAPLLILL